jgi:ketosteroid isomerase-like protein
MPRIVRKSAGLGLLLALASCASMPQSTGQSTAITGADPVANVVVPFFEAVAREDLSAAQAFLTPETKVQLMFNPNGQNGVDAARAFPASAYFNIVTRNYDNIVFSDRTFSVSGDRSTVWMEAQGNLVVAATGQPYRNGYVFKLTLTDNKIVGIQEWVNTVTLTQQGIAARPTTP